jgi:hypothetical protein
MRKARFVYLVLFASIFAFLFAAAAAPLGFSDGGHPWIRF